MKQQQRKIRLAGIDFWESGRLICHYFVYVILCTYIVHVVIVLIYNCCTQMQNQRSLLPTVASNRGLDPKIPFRQS